MIDLQTLGDAEYFTAGISSLESDPLSSFRYVSEAQKKTVQYVSKNEVLLRSGNAAGKTYLGAALAVRLLRGDKDELGGVPLPDVRTPCVGWCLVQTYKAQVDSAQAAVLHWLGSWTHKKDMLRADIIDTLWVATKFCTHGMGERCRTCSKLVFHCSESPSSIGGRIDFAWADEPPDYEVWDNMRQRGGADRRLIRFITATPKEKKWWWWLADREYGFVGCEDKPVNGLVEVRCSIFDNKALSKDALADKVAMAEKSQYRDAILNGDYVDLRGECPFDVSRLQEWNRRPCVRDPELESLVIQSERTFEDGRRLVERRIETQVWEPPQQGYSYLMVLDPSSGVKSRAHDPAGLHIYKWTGRPSLVLRYVDYLDPYGLGYLASKLAVRYNKALVDIDVTGGYGTNSITAMSQQHYHNIVRDYHEDHPAGISPRLGFVITAVNRAEITTSIVRALEEDSIVMPSREVLSSLLNISVDEKDKWLATPGQARHDEDMICLGRALHLISTLPAPRPKAVKVSDQLRKTFGGWSEALPKPGRPKTRWKPT